MEFTIKLKIYIFTACKRKEEEKIPEQELHGPKKPRLVFTDKQRKNLHEIFKQNKRPSKEMQVKVTTTNFCQ